MDGRLEAAAPTGRVQAGTRLRAPSQGSQSSGRLIELELRGRVGGSEIEGWSLVEIKLSLGRTASGRDAGRLMGQIEMEQDALHGGG